MAATAAELALAYGQGALDMVMELAIMPDSDRHQILAQARADRDLEMFELCGMGKHWLAKFPSKTTPCPYCFWSENARP